MNLYADRTFRIDTENAFKVGPHIVRVERQRDQVVKLNLGEPDFPVPDHIKDEIKCQLDLDNTHYCDPQGVIGLRQAIASQVSKTRGIEAGPEQVVVFPGGKPPIGLAQQVYCNPGDEVIYPSPGFPIYESFIRYVEGVPVPLHLDEASGFTFKPEHLAELITSRTKLIYLNFPSNPTGGVATLEELEAIAEVIRERCSEAVRVYSDEIYEYIIFDGRRHNSIASLPGMARITVIASGFSKTFAWTGGRIGYAVFPSAEEANIFKNLNINYFSCVPPYNQEAARVALESPLSQPAVKRMVRIFQKRRDVIWEKLNQIPGVTCKKPGGAFYLFPNIAYVCEHMGLTKYHERMPEPDRGQTSPAGLFQMFALYLHGVALLDRLSFGRLGADGEEYLRLSTASELEVLEEGVRRLKNATEDISGLHQFLENRPDLQ